MPRRARSSSRAASAAAHSNLGDRVRAGRSLRRVGRALPHRDRRWSPTTTCCTATLAYALLAAGRDRRGVATRGSGALHGGPRGSERRRRSPALDARRHATAACCCYREQGVGDEIMFASLYPDLIDGGRRGRDRVRPAARAAVRAFVPRRRGPRADVSTIAAARRCTTSTARSPPAACRSWFRPRSTRFPDRRSFLVADPERVAQWRERLAEIGPGPVRRACRGAASCRPPNAGSSTRASTSGARSSRCPASPGSTSSTTTASASCATPSASSACTIHRWDWLDLMNDFEEVAALDRVRSTSSSRRATRSRCSAARSACRTVMMGNRWDWSELGTDTSPWFPTIQLVVPRMLGEEWDDGARDRRPRREVARLAAHARHDLPITKTTEEHTMLDLNGSTILLTGGTGSFGNAFVRARHSTAGPTPTVRVYSRDELKQSEMRDPLRRQPGPLPHRRRPRPVPHDPRGRRRRHRRARRRDEAGARVRVQPVRSRAHQRARRAARRRRRDRRARVRRVVALSTDKAVNPVNLYGATKLCAEKIFVQGNAYAAQRQTRLACVRYGNVVGSRGSVVPVFQRAARARRPHHDHRRAHDPLLDHAAPGRRPRALRARATWRAARCSSRRSRRCASSTSPRRSRPACRTT